MVAEHWLLAREGRVMKDGRLLHERITSPEQLYDECKSNYPKFYKMDVLCKWAFAAAECLLENGNSYSGVDKTRIAVVLATSHGCLDVDARYAATQIPSPALFVYTLPNIMLGELCIRHGFKGEQLCLVSERFDPGELYFNVQRLLQGGMDACLCGWVDAAGGKNDLCLFWVKNNGNGTEIDPPSMIHLYTQVIV